MGQKTLRCFLVMRGGGGRRGIRLWRWSLGCHESLSGIFIEIPSKSLFISSRMSLQTLPCPVLFLVPHLEEEWGQEHKKNNFATKSVLYVASQTIFFNAGRGSFNFCCLRGLKVIERRAIEPPPHPKGNQND